MKKISASFATALLATLFLLLLPQTLSAQSKVGFVDMGRITSETKVVRQLAAEMEKHVGELKRPVDEKEKQIEALAQDVQRTEGVISNDERMKKEKEVQRLLNERDDLLGRARKKVREYNDELVVPMSNRIRKAIHETARKGEFDLIQTEENVVYASARSDITDQVIALLDKGEATSKLPGDSGTTATRAGGTPQREAPLLEQRLLPSTAFETKETPNPVLRGLRPVDRQKD
ncbi:MAG: OmpH family outer membrane protein [Candidatus Sumerlaeaceae bacterium]|nr:OmpH family outer membrane protein [Candidatus Sumerlaeaceae bacterium]